MRLRLKKIFLYIIIVVGFLVLVSLAYVVAQKSYSNKDIGLTFTIPSGFIYKQTGGYDASTNQGRSVIKLYYPLSTQRAQVVQSVCKPNVIDCGFNMNGSDYEKKLVHKLFTDTIEVILIKNYKNPAAMQESMKKTAAQHTQTISIAGQTVDSWISNSTVPATEKNIAYTKRSTGFYFTTNSDNYFVFVHTQSYSSEEALTEAAEKIIQSLKILKQ